MKYTVFLVHFAHWHGASFGRYKILRFYHMILLTFLQFHGKASNNIFNNISTIYIMNIFIYDDKYNICKYVRYIYI